MKVCHLTSVHKPNDTRIFIKECASLAEHFETHLVVANTSDETTRGIHIHGVKTTVKNRLLRMTVTVRKVYQKALEIDAELYHFHDPELLFVGWLLKKRGKHVIYDSHEDAPRQILSKKWIKKPLRRLISSAFERIENFIVKRLDAVVTATPFIDQRFSDLGCRTVNVNNYPILDELIDVNNEQGKIPKKRAVCYVGGINEIRGVYEMVKALEETRDVTLLLGGGFQPNHLKNEVSKLKAWKQVEYLDYLSRKDMADVFSESMAGLVLFHPEPNHFNAQPNKMFEYMSAGLPVIASDFELWRTIIEGNRCGICVNPMDPEKIGEAIQWVADHPEKAEEMGRNGREAVESKYNWKLESRKLLDLYRQLLNVEKRSTAL